MLLKGLSFLYLTKTPGWAQGAYRSVVGLCEGQLQVTDIC